MKYPKSIIKQSPIAEMKDGEKDRVKENYIVS